MAKKSVPVVSDLVPALPDAPSNSEAAIVDILDSLAKTKLLENDADINKLSHVLLEIVNDCIPLAVKSYREFPKESSARALNSFISQTREISNDIRSLQDKKKNVNKLIASIIQPAFTQIYEEMINIPEHLKDVESLTEYEENVKAFLTHLLKNVHNKIEDIF